MFSFPVVPSPLCLTAQRLLLCWTYHLLTCPCYVLYQFQCFRGISLNHGEIFSSFPSVGQLCFPFPQSELLLCLSSSSCPQKHQLLLCELKWHCKCCLCLAPDCSWVVSMLLVPCVHSDLVAATLLPAVHPLLSRMLWNYWNRYLWQHKWVMWVNLDGTVSL